MAAVRAASWGGGHLAWKSFVFLCVITLSAGFALSGEETDEVSSKKAGPVLVGNFSVSQKNDTQAHGHESSKNSSCACESEDVDGEEKHADKIEQLLWDIFVDDEHTSSDGDGHTGLEQDERYREEEENDDESRVDKVANNEEEGVPPHSISKRSAVEPEEEMVSEREGRRSNPNEKRGNKGSNKKGKVQPGLQKGNSNRHSNRVKSKAKKSTNVQKYNEYMDVVLRRMNSMIKSKKMDPLMVNLFSGNQQQPQQQKQKPQSGESKKNNKNKNKKKKNKTNGKKKRKGAKNQRARMEELDEMEARSVSSDSDSSATIELDNEHDGIHGVRGVFIRRVGEYEQSGEEDEEEHDGEVEDDAEEEGDNERAFRQIRALIVNGSMKRSLNETESVPPSPPSPTAETTKSSAEEETRGFSDSTPSSSEESPRKKASNKDKKKSDKKKQNKEKATTSNKNKPAPQKKSRATRGVLKGLSSLKRSGNVDVVRQSDNVRIVRGRFILGPVTLEIVPKGPKKDVTEPEEEERSSKGKQKRNKDESESPKVTAIARELKGVIEVRLKKNAPTTIKRLRVFPPSAVNVKSNSKSKVTGKANGGSVPRYNRVTPVATHRLRQIASAVVRQADVRRKSTNLEQARH